MRSFCPLHYVIGMEVAKLYSFGGAFLAVCCSLDSILRPEGSAEPPQDHGESVTVCRGGAGNTPGTDDPGTVRQYPHHARDTLRVDHHFRAARWRFLLLGHWNIASAIIAAK